MPPALLLLLLLLLLLAAFLHDASAASSTELSAIMAFKTLYLSAANIGGEIPSAIGGLTKLVDLELADNLLTNEIPATIV
jgi:hypothetical protein